MTGSSVAIPARHGKALVLMAGQAVKLVNTHGTQVVDCWAWRRGALEEFMSMEATRVWNQQLNPKVGDTLVTNRRNPILTIVDDTSPGVHDSFMAACDRQRYERLNVEGYHRNCFDNMLEAVRDLGYEVPNPTLASLNVFMNIAVKPDGRSLDTLPTLTQPGDFITFRAEMECIVAFSACPQDIVKIQGQADNTPRNAHFSILENGDYPALPVSQAWIPG
jgi:uncharacterized protein YcgI (DUF1989 family)